ncbi:MAG: MCE family protein [Hyphomicrobiales bacterium]|nr:MCE family protein [Hyphomicrobiales bacterium]
MEIRANYIIIGLFTLLAIGLAFGFGLWVVRYGETSTQRAVNVVFVGSVSGLARGSPVYFKGIKIGDVTGLSFDTEDPDLVTARIRVDPKAPLKIDSVARLGVQGLTGTGYIEFIGGSAQTLSLFEQGDVPTVLGEGSGLQDIVENARSVLSRIDDMVARLDVLVRENDQEVAAAIQNVRKFTDALANNSEGVDSFLKNVSEAAEQISGLSDRLGGFVDNAETVIAAIDPDSVRKIVGNVETFTESLAETSKFIDSFVADARRVAEQLAVFTDGLNALVDDVKGVVGAIDKAQIERTIANVAKFSDRLETTGGDIEQFLADARTSAANVKDFTQTLADNRERVEAVIADATEISQSLKDASKRIDEVIDKAGKALGSEDGEGFFAEARKAAQSIREVADSFNARADEISSGLARFSNRSLRDVETFVQDGRRTLANLDRVITSLERDPQSFIFGKSQIPEYNPRRR